MGIFDFIKKQFIDVIQWNESGDGVLAWRFPVKDQEIQNGAQLVVRETQVAMFVNEGEVADIFEPGTHTLTTRTLPVLTNLKHWDKGFQSPFKSDVYFFSTRDQLDQRWGTSQPITVRDKEFGAIRIRAHGTFSYKLRNPKTFFKKVSGTRDTYTTMDLEGQLRATILTNMATFLAGSSIAFIDMAANQNKFSDALKAALAPSLEQYGLSLESFFVQSISLPEELQGHLDKAAGMKMVGDLKKYAQFQAADSLGSGTGGAAGAGMELAAGLAMGRNMSDALGGGSGASESDSAMGQIGKLHELMTKGVITKEEFEAKKAELLKKIT